MINLSYKQLVRKSIGWVLKWRHPFWWLPDVPTEQDEAFRRIWQHLRQVNEVVDGRHDSPEWSARGGEFVFCCVRVPQSALSENLAALREVLDDFPFVRLHPDRFLHIAVQELGFLTGTPTHRTDITQVWLDEFISQSRHAISEFAPFDVTLGGVNSFVDAAFLDVHDNGWLSRIQGRFTDFVKVPPSYRYAYLPVVTIAHYTGSAPIGNLVASLTPFRDQQFGAFRVDAIDIVKISTGEPYPDLEVIHSFELGQEPGLIEVIQGSTRSDDHPHNS